MGCMSSEVLWLLTLLVYVLIPIRIAWAVGKALLLLLAAGGKYLLKELELGEGEGGKSEEKNWEMHVGVTVAASYIGQLQMS